MLVELTISKKEGGKEILGVINQIIKYRKNGEGVVSSDNEERIILFSKYDYIRTDLTKEEISLVPKIDYYPMICKRTDYYKNNTAPEMPGKIIDIKEINQILKPQS